MTPLTTAQQFLVGDFALPDSPATRGPLPASLSSLPRDRTPLPPGAWIRFQSIGRGPFAGWSAQLLVEPDGRAFQLVNEGQATAEKIEHPVWPQKPNTKLDAAMVEQIRKRLAGFTGDPPWRGREGVPHAPVFVLAVRSEGRVSEVVFEAFFDDPIAYLRWISQYVYDETPAARRAPARARSAGSKPPPRKPAKKAE